MTQNDDKIRLRHMLDAAQKTLQFADGRQREDLDRDEMFMLAIVRLIEVIGEAAKHVSGDVKEAAPEVPWRQITGTRNRLIHGYFDVDLDIIWQIVTNDLPPLIEHLESMLTSDEENETDDANSE